MKYEDAARMVKESGLRDEEKDDYALWVPFEDQHEIYDSADPIRHTDEGVRGVELRGDPQITSPQVLPVDVRDFDEEVLHDPPIRLVQDLLDPTMKRVDRPTVDRAIVRDRTFYEVEQVRYQFYLDRIEDAMQLGQLRELVSQAEEGRWTMELSENNSLLFTRRPEPGQEYTDEKLRFEVESARQADSVETMLQHLDVKRTLAEAAIEAIDGEQRRKITERVMREVEQEEELPMVPSEEAEVSDELTFETEEDEVVVGEQIVVLGGLYMATTLNG